MTPSSSSYSSPTHIHTSLSSSPSPVSSTSQSLGSMGALLSPKSTDLTGQDSHYHFNSSHSNHYHHSANPMGSVKESPRGKGVSSKKSRPSLSSATASAPSTGISNLTTAPSTSIHAIASATATGTRGGITAVTANMSPPSANLSPVSVTSPTSSATSPTSSSSTSSKKKSGQASKKAAGGAPAGADSVPSKFPKPTQSYSFLITTAILESPNSQLTLNEIYEWVMLHYPWYRTAINGWKVNNNNKWPRRVFLGWGFLPLFLFVCLFPFLTFKGLSTNGWGCFFWLNLCSVGANPTRQERIHFERDLIEHHGNELFQRINTDRAGAAEDVRVRGEGG